MPNRFPQPAHTERETFRACSKCHREVGDTSPGILYCDAPRCDNVLCGDCGHDLHSALGVCNSRTCIDWAVEQLAAEVAGLYARLNSIKKRAMEAQQWWIAGMCEWRKGRVG